MDLQAVWDNHDDVTVMLDLLRDSRYRHQYYEGLVEFARWLRSKRQLEFDPWLSNVTAKRKREVNKGRLTNEELKEDLLEIVLHDAKTSISELLQSVKDASRWETYSAEIPRKEQLADKLRKLIPTPLLPKTPDTGN